MSTDNERLLHTMPPQKEALLDDQQPLLPKASSAPAWWPASLPEPRSLLRDSVIIAGCVVMAISCSIVYAVNTTLASKIVKDLSVSPQNMNVIVGLSVIGLQFTLPAGLVLDRVGPAITGFIGLVLAVAGFVGVSFIDSGTSWPAILVLFIVVSIGEGFSFLAAFKTSIEMSPTGGGIGMGLVSVAMSLSLTFALGIVTIYTGVTGCDDDSCWVSYVRVWAVATAACMAIGIACLLLFKRRNYPHLVERDGGGAAASASDSTKKETLLSDPEVESLLPGGSGHIQSASGEFAMNDEYKEGDEEDEEAEEAVSCLGGLHILRHPYFWALTFAYFSVMGSSVIIITQGKQLWLDYSPSKDFDSWVPSVLSAYSFVNAGSNFVTGMLADVFVRKDIMHPRRFWTIVIGFSCVLYIILGVLFEVGNATKGSMVAVAIIFALIGSVFGAVLVLGGMTMGLIYGYRNFGVYFSYMQIGGSIGSAISPLIAGAIYERFNSYNSVIWGWLIILALSGAGLLFVPLTPYKTPKKST